MISQSLRNLHHINNINKYFVLQKIKISLGCLEITIVFDAGAAHCYRKAGEQNHRKAREERHEKRKPFEG
jgi:hypothetical protein